MTRGAQQRGGKNANRRLACRKTLASKQRAPGPKTTYSKYACSAGRLLSWPKIRAKTRGGREESRVINPGQRENRARRPLQISKTRGSSGEKAPARAAGRGLGKSSGSGGAKKKSSGGPASKPAPARREKGETREKRKRRRRGDAADEQSRSGEEAHGRGAAGGNENDRPLGQNPGDSRERVELILAAELRAVRTRRSIVRTAGVTRGTPTNATPMPGCL